MIELAVTNWIFRLLLLALIFLLVAAAFMYVINLVSQRSRTASRLAQLGGRDANASLGTLALEDRHGAWARMAERIEKGGLSLEDSDNDKLRKTLRLAGYNAQSAPRVYTLVRIILVFLLPGIFLLMSLTKPEPPSIAKLYLVSALLAAMGLYLPNIFVRAKADRRREEIVNGFPDCLDLLLVCVEAGLGLEAALGRVGREMVTTHPLVAEMLSETTLMLRAGASREDALRKLSERAAVDEIRSFATLLIQSDRLGTSIANTLRVYAAEMRESRKMRAEEKAHRLPVLISIPLVVCMLPTMIGVLALPAAIMVIREVGPALTGGGG